MCTHCARLPHKCCCAHKQSVTVVHAFVSVCIRQSLHCTPSGGLQVGQFAAVGPSAQHMPTQHLCPLRWTGRPSCRSTQTTNLCIHGALPCALLLAPLLTHANPTPVPSQVDWEAILSQHPNDQPAHSRCTALRSAAGPSAHTSHPTTCALSGVGLGCVSRGASSRAQGSAP